MSILFSFKFLISYIFLSVFNFEISTFSNVGVVVGSIPAEVVGGFVTARLMCSGLIILIYRVYIVLTEYVYLSYVRALFWHAAALFT